MSFRGSVQGRHFLGILKGEHVMSRRRGKVIHDVLDQYRRQLDFLHVVR